MPAPYEWALIDGLNDFYKAQSGNSGGASGDSSGYSDSTPGLGFYSDEDIKAMDYDPRFPSASRGDEMAGVEQLEALGIQYSRE